MVIFELGGYLADRCGGGDAQSWLFEAVGFLVWSRSISLSLEWELDRRSGLINKETRSKDALIPQRGRWDFHFAVFINQRGGLRGGGTMALSG